MFTDAMTAAQPTSRLYSFDEYVALEQAEGIRYEYWDGEVIAMAGTTKRHNVLVQNISFALRPFARQKGFRYTQKTCGKS